MSIIEQAVKRLEQLKRAGIEIPQIDGIDVSGAGSGSIAAALKAGNGAAVVSMKARPVRTLNVASAPAPTPAPVEPAAAARVSKSIEIDLKALAELGYLTPNAGSRALADEFRVTKMQLIKDVRAGVARGDARSNLILITSSVPGEGKTFVSINLAMSLAMEVDKSVLLIDADVLRPTVMSRLGLRSDLGLIDLVRRHDLDVADVMLRTNIPKLSLIPAGTQTDKSTELLASDGMERLLVELAERYPDRIVIFDAPPLLVATEARELASKVGQVLLVVEANRTDSDTVARAFAAVESCPNVSSVFNRCPRMTLGTGYGYYNEC